MTESVDDTATLLDQARSGNGDAADRLLLRHRNRLKQMISIRMDERLRTRVDPSDVVQESLVRAHQQLEDYLQEPAVSFYPWLRQIALNRLVDEQRRHIFAEKRSVRREHNHQWHLSDESTTGLMPFVSSSDSGPLQQIAKEELHRAIRHSIKTLDDVDRDVLVMRLLEQMSVREVAEALGLTRGAVKNRQYRALRRLRTSLLTGFDSESDI